MRIDWHREKQALQCLVFLVAVSLAAAFLALSMEQGIANLFHRFEDLPRRGSPLPVEPTIAAPYRRDCLRCATETREGNQSAVLMA